MFFDDEILKPLIDRTLGYIIHHILFHISYFIWLKPIIDSTLGSTGRGMQLILFNTSYSIEFKLATFCST